MEDVFKKSDIRHIAKPFSEANPGPQGGYVEIWDETEQRKEGDDTKESIEPCLVAEEQVSRSYSETLLTLETPKMLGELCCFDCCLLTIGRPMKK